MSEDNEKDKMRDEADSFWSFEELMPRRPRRGTAAPRASTEAVDIVADSPEDEKGSGGAVKIPPRGSAAAASGHAADARKNVPELVYEPSGTLLRRVTVMKWHTEYRFYEHFFQSARHYEHKTADECRAVEFFSFMPQYSQLDSAQLAFYLYWREEVRRGVALPVEYSYIVLYIYELINLYSGTPQAAHAVGIMCFLWRSYRNEYPHIDTQLKEWVCDMCLVNQLPPPLPEMRDIPRSAYLDGASLREFYIDTGSGGIENALISYCSNYDWHKSRYAATEAAPFYKEHIPAAAAAALRACKSGADDAEELFPGMKYVSTVRDVFIGAICVPGIKKRLYIDYCSFSRSHEIRFLVTDILKYTENRLRAALGIKSRLSFGSLPTAARAAVDEYFAEKFPPAARRMMAKKPETVPEYEKLYDPLPENNTLSLENAARIESESWLTTDRLVEAFADEGDAPAAELLPPPPADTPAAAPKDGDGNAELTAAWGENTEFVLAALDGDGDAERRFAAAHGTLADAVADAVNDAAAEIFGDIILEEVGGAYRVLDDYADEIRALLSAEKQ